MAGQATEEGKTMNDYMTVAALTVVGLVFTVAVFGSGWVAGWQARDAAAQDETRWARWLVKRRGNRAHKI
jgi:hypothetical protein